MYEENYIAYHLSEIFKKVNKTRIMIYYFHDKILFFHDLGHNSIVLFAFKNSMIFLMIFNK